jgi:CBS domain-containing protein
MVTVRSILDHKIPRVLISVSPDQSAFEAIQLMAKHDIGAVVVMEQERLVGLFTEREYARKVILMGRASKDTPVKAAMIDKLLVISPDMTTQDCMQLMTEKRIRYLPVIDRNGPFLGIISIGDVVKAVIDAQAHNIEHLERYLTASDYGL